MSGPHTGGYEDLTNVIDPNSLECLNQKPDLSIKNIFPPTGMVLESDADEQLLLGVGFKQSVKIFSVDFVAPNDGRKPDNIKIWANRAVTDFGEAEDTPGTQDFKLEWKPHQGDQVKASCPMRFVKFQDIKMLSVFVADNTDGGETTAINAITFYGSAKGDTNMKELKKVG